jgi:hypothetical protein
MCVHVYQEHLMWELHTYNYVSAQYSIITYRHSVVQTDFYKLLTLHNFT